MKTRFQLGLQANNVFETLQSPLADIKCINLESTCLVWQKLLPPVNRSARLQDIFGTEIIVLPGQSWLEYRKSCIQFVRTQSRDCTLRNTLGIGLAVDSPRFVRHRISCIGLHFFSRRNTPKDGIAMVGTRPRYHRGHEMLVVSRQIFATLHRFRSSLVRERFHPKVCTSYLAIS